LDDAQKRRGEDRALLFVLPKQARVRRPTTRPRLVLRERELEAGRECRKQAKAALIDVVVENGEQVVLRAHPRCARIAPS
jgi:hypothetical protein